jgi:hypothetical protein
MKKLFITAAITAALSTTAAFADAGTTTIQGITFDTEVNTLNNAYVMALNFNEIQITNNNKTVTGTITSINNTASFCNNCTFTFKYEQNEDSLGSVLEFYMTQSDAPHRLTSAPITPTWLSLAAKNQNGHLNGNRYHAFYNITGGAAASYFTTNIFTAFGNVPVSGDPEKYVAYGNGSPDFFFTYTAAHFASGPSFAKTNGSGQFVLEYAKSNAASASAPATLGLLGLGLIGMGLLSRRRRS